MLPHFVIKTATILDTKKKFCMWGAHTKLSLGFFQQDIFWGNLGTVRIPQSLSADDLGAVSDISRQRMCVAPSPSQFLFFSPPKIFFLFLQVQASWLQHDLGHLSVFRKTKWNHLLHKFVMCHLIVSPWKTSEGFHVKTCVLKTLWSMCSTGGRIRVRK